MATVNMTARIQVTRRGRLFDIRIDGGPIFTKDITDFAAISEEEVPLALALLDEHERQKAEESH